MLRFLNDRREKTRLMTELTRTRTRARRLMQSLLAYELERRLHEMEREEAAIRVEAHGATVVYMGPERRRARRA